jgi:hypothetical protein
MYPIAFDDDGTLGAVAFSRSSASRRRAPSG